MTKDNIILIGMPGAGKSTIGVVLAKTLGMTFVDTDLIIQQRDGRLLQEIIDTDGMDDFLNAENNALINLKSVNMVIATGGSAVFCEEGMEHLAEIGKIVYLMVSYEEIERRVNNITTRGIAMRHGASLMDVYSERSELYERYADVIVDCGDGTVEDVINQIIKIIGE